MKNIIKFLIFLLYSFSIFFLPNNKLILIFIVINLFVMTSILNKETIKNIIINTDEIKVMICISMSMIPILKKDLKETKEACIAKNISFNVKNTKYILLKFFLTFIKRVNQIEESLISKGYDY